ncbi:glutaredoxin domain-containing protein [Granulosicoccaceae sp. 1_MG-2023]|nr:glutaredoxin domain-containing protein [Granulosicoccaceae sp. 1_MG-2023]
MSVIRWILGKLILIWNRLTWPQATQRSPEAQAAVDKALGNYELFELTACPFCVKVRRETRRLGIEQIPRRNVREEPAAKEALLAGGGKYQVPCLRVQAADGASEWLYESDDIIARLQADFPAAG